MNDTGISHFNQARIEWAIRLRYSPMPHLDMKWLTSNLNAFRIGEMRTVGKIWEIMVELDAELGVNFDKRASDLAGLEWQIVSDGSLDGDLHAQALTYFYNKARVTRALDQDLVGGAPELLYQMATAHLHYYSAHEMLMRVDNPAAKEITCEFRHTPVWFFESRRGYLGYLKHIFDMYGMPCLSGEWLTCVGQGWMRPLCIAYAMKHFPLRDWLLWCSRYGSGFLEGVSDATKGSPEWEEAYEALRTIANDGVVLHSRGVEMKFLEQAARNQQPFEPLVERVDRLYSKCFRGIDLATGTRAASPGGGGTGGAAPAVGASLQGEESGIFLLRDAKWATGYANDRIDRPVIRTLFDQEPRAAFVVMPPLEDTTAEDLQTVTGLVPLGFRIALAEAYKRFRWQPPKAGEPCLQAPQPVMPPINGNANGNGNGNAKNPVRKDPPIAEPDAPKIADPADAETQPAQTTDETPIGAGADPARNPGLIPTEHAPRNTSPYFQAPSRQMPDPQVDAASFWSAAGATARAMMPSLGYAIPNDSPELAAPFTRIAGSQFASAFAGDMQHLRDRLAAIMQIKDPALLKAKLQGFLDDLPDISADALADPESARALADATATAALEGMTAEKTDSAAVANNNPYHDESGRFSSADDAATANVKSVMSGKLDESAYAKVSPATAAKIKAATGRDVTGYSHFIDKDALTHIHKNHGVGRELPGQPPVTAEDVEKIPHIVANPDTVEYGGTSGRGFHTIKYGKRFNGATYYVEEEWGKDKLLAAKTMYKKSAPGESATPERGVSHTSKTSGAKPK